MQHQTLSFTTRNRGLLNITPDINAAIQKAAITEGLCHLFIQHTSASLLINENSDPDVLHDLENFMQKLIPDDNALYTHTAEGIDDMPAHIRSALTQTNLTIPIQHGKLALGTWQAVYLWEHRIGEKTRHVIVTCDS